MMLAIVIPTRDRAALAVAAVQSLLEERGPWEIFVADNSTSDAAVRRVSEFCREAGVAYMRAPAPLAMAAHWDWALREVMDHSCATHVAIHYDRRISRPNEMAALVSIAAQYPDRLISYTLDHISGDAPRYTLWQPRVTGRLYEVQTARVLELTARAALGRVTQAVPLLSNCLVPRAIAERIRDQFGSVCDSAAPDTAFLFRFCAIEERYLHSDRSAGVVYAQRLGNERSVVNGQTQLALDDAPIPGLNIGRNFIFHEYQRVRRETGSERFPPIDRGAYIHDLARGLEPIRGAEVRKRLHAELRKHGWRGNRPPRARWVIAKLLPIVRGTRSNDEAELLAHARNHPGPLVRANKALAPLDPAEVRRRSIVHVVSTPIGAPWMVALAREQKRAGHDVAVILPSLDGNIARELSRDNIRSYAAPAAGLIYGAGVFGRLSSVVRLARLLRRLRPDIVHSHIFASVMTSRVASWIADVPVHLGGNVHPISLQSEVMRVLEIGTAFCDTKTIASSTYTRQLYIEHGVPADQVELIFYAVDQSGHDPALVSGAEVRRQLGIAAGTPVIGKIAYFYPVPRFASAVPPFLRGRGIKGHDVFLRAVPHVLESMPGAKFVLVGRGWGPEGLAYEQTLRDLATALGVGHAVLFAGETSDVPAMLAAFDVSVHCSLSDNVAGTVESLLMERAMVVSDIPGFADTVIHEETGLLAPPDDPPALAAAIVRLLRDRELSRRLSQNGRARMLNRFTLGRTVADYEALMSRLPARASDHYRLTTTVARALGAPFRLLPVAFRAWRALRAGRS